MWVLPVSLQMASPKPSFRDQVVAPSSLSEIELLKPSCHAEAKLPLQVSLCPEHASVHSEYYFIQKFASNTKNQNEIQNVAV